MGWLGCKKWRPEFPLILSKRWKIFVLLNIMSSCPHIFIPTGMAWGSLDWYFLIQFSVLLMWLAYYSDLKIQKWANLDKLYRWNNGFFYFWAIFGVNFDPLMVSRLWTGQFLLKYDMLYHFGNGRTTARHMCWFWNNISTLR